jgi:periplasmic protein TonB
MDAATFPLTISHRESLRGSVLVSLVLHAMLGGLAVGYTALRLHQGVGWGNPWGGKTSSIRVNVVNSLPGIPLPAPRLATPNTLATENPGLYHKEPEPTAEPPKHAEEIPKFQDTVKPNPPVRVNRRIEKESEPPPPVRVNKRIQQEAEPAPLNAIPTGEGGKPSITYGQFVNGEGSGNLSFGEGMFGERYGWYVEAARNRISSNWLMSTISSNVLSAHRVYVSFDILRDGTITNVRLTQSSGNPEIDRSALRAIYASNPLGPLPQDYSGSKVSVNFYFDFSRQ